MPMTNDHFRRRRPDRRYRRLLPAAVAAVTIAASAPFLTPGSARAETPRTQHEARPAPAGKIPALIGVTTARGPKVQTNGAT
jgi:hypothetical protein